MVQQLVQAVYCHPGWVAALQRNIRYGLLPRHAFAGAL